MRSDQGGARRAHNPKAAGSNPAPAIQEEAGNPLHKKSPGSPGLSSFSGLCQTVVKRTPTTRGGLAVIEWPRSAGDRGRRVEYRWRVMYPRGAYPADRAAALSGVPLSTVHWWARHDVLVPSVSAERVKLWSYADLMGLRIIYWLRQTKTTGEAAMVPRSAMPAVRRALAQLSELDLGLWNEDTGPTVAVDRKGEIFITKAEPNVEGPFRQRRFDNGGGLLEITAPFATGNGARGPDLRVPRPQLRIVPGKLGGSPHVVHTRLESQALWALVSSGLGEAKVYRLYPSVAPEAIDEALDLERQLAANLRLPVAA